MLDILLMIFEFLGVEPSDRVPFLLIFTIIFILKQLTTNIDDDKMRKIEFLERILQFILNGIHIMTKAESAINFYNVCITGDLKNYFQETIVDILQPSITVFNYCKKIYIKIKYLMYKYKKFR